MATLSVWKFETPEGAEQAERALLALQKQELIQVHDAATVSWEPGRKKPKTRQANNLAAAGALGGTFWGLLFGLLFFVPLLGAAVGAAAGALGGSLADGQYQLILHADRIRDSHGNALDGDADGTSGGDRADAFHRLYGDSDGDRDVDLRDLKRFLGALGRRAGGPHYLWYFDVNDDDRIGVIDLLAFTRRLGSHLEP